MRLRWCRYGSRPRFRLQLRLRLSTTSTIGSNYDDPPNHGGEGLYETGHSTTVDVCVCHSGRDALGYYHEKKDEQRDVGLGPEHDWSSHAADAFGLMAIAYEEPSRLARFNRKIEYPNLGIV